MPGGAYEYDPFDYSRPDYKEWDEVPAFEIEAGPVVGERKSYTIKVPQAALSQFSAEDMAKAFEAIINETFKKSIFDNDKKKSFLQMFEKVNTDGVR